MNDDNAPERPGCPVMIAHGLYDVDAKWPQLAERMLLAHLAIPHRTCCDPDGFALDPETGCTAAEMATPPRRSIAHWHRMRCAKCKTREARWDSLFCSEACKREFLTFPEVA